MIKIGVTGGIGSGKSTVCNMFSKLGVPIFDTDSAAKVLMADNPEIKDRIILLFGEEAYINGTLNRRYISSLVFNNDALLKQLNAIVHPVVAEKFKEWAAMQNTVYVIMECAILFESGLESLVDKIVTVSAPEHIRIERAARRDDVPTYIIEARISKQMSDMMKEKRSDYIIKNADLNATREQVEQLDKIFKNEDRKLRSGF